MIAISRVVRRRRENQVRQHRRGRAMDCYVGSQVHPSLLVREAADILAPEGLVPVLRRVGSIVSSSTAREHQHCLVAVGMLGLHLAG